MRISFRCAGVLLLAALLATSACDSPKDLEAKYTTHGKSLYDSGDLVKATLEFKNALQIDPNATEPQFYLGLIAEKQKNFEAAAIAFAKVADKDPHHFQANLKAGQYALLGGDADAAQHYGKQLIAIAPDKPDGHTMIAAAFLLRGKLPEAETEAKAALSIDPKNVDAMVVLAGRQARGSNNDEALAIVERGLAVNPKSTDLLLLKLKLVFDMKRSADVIAVLQQLHGADPSNPNYVIDLANQLAAAGKLDEAESIFKQSLDANKDSDALLSAYAGFLVQRRSLDVAIGQIKQLSGETSQAPKYALLLEQLYIRAGKLDDAAALMSTLQQNATAAGDRLRAQVELARIALLKGDHDGALKSLNDVVTADAANEPALLLRGAVMLSDAKYDNAIADARSVLHQNINSLPGLTLLSKAYIATGEANLAIDTLRSIVRLSPNDVDARLQLATQLASKSPDDAMQNLDAAIALRPDAVELKIQKAEFLAKTGAPDKAELIGRDLASQAAYAGVGHRIIAISAMARSDYPTAIAELNQAQAAGQPFETVGPLLVSAYVRSGKTDQADAMLSDRIAKDPKDTRSLILLAAVRTQTGKFDAAEQLLRQAIAAKPQDSEAYLDLVQLLGRLHRNEDAVKVASDAAKAFPDNHDVALTAAVAYDTVGDFQSARSGYEGILARWPGDTIAANNLAALIADVWPGDRALLDRARQLAEKFRSSDNPALLDTLGWVLLRQGNFDDASILLARVTAAVPDNQQIQFHYAMALKAKGLKAQAQNAFDKALGGTPDYRGLDEAKQAAATLK